MKRAKLWLALASVASLLWGDSSARAQPDDPRLSPWTEFVTEAAEKFRLPRDWIEAVILAESAGRTTLNGRPTTSRKGAMGLMQLMPATYADMQKTYGLGSDPYDPHDNILAGSAYLRLMFDRFGYPGLFGAYNAGPTTFSASLSGGKLPSETRIYLARLTHKTVSPAPRPTLFVALSAAVPSTADEQSSGLFAPLSATKAPAY